ncbi:Expansin [Psidium guajava]|nr:Expansin [Psidium guajava]
MRGPFAIRAVIRKREARVGALLIDEDVGARSVDRVPPLVGGLWYLRDPPCSRPLRNRLGFLPSAPR